MSFALQASAPGVVSPSPSVLVVKDNRDSREMLCTWLEQRSARRVAAAGPASRARQIGELPERSRSILLDFMMPGMNGWQFRTAQRSQRRLRHVPVAVMTAHTKPVGEAEWLDPGSDSVQTAAISRRCLPSSAAAEGPPARRSSRSLPSGNHLGEIQALPYPNRQNP